MKQLAILCLSLLLAACAMTPPPSFSREQINQSSSLAVLSDNSGDVLAAAALPLHFYCQHHRWPLNNELNTTQPLVADLVGLSYHHAVNNQLEADFSLLNDVAGNPSQKLSQWQLFISKPKVDLQHKQQIRLQINSSDVNVHLTNYMDFSCVSKIHRAQH